MTFKDLRLGVRALIKDPAYWLIAVLGLSVGLAACFLLLGFVKYSWQYDAYIPEVDDVYVVKHRDNLRLGAPWYDQSPTLLLATARTTPGVANASGYLSWFPLTVEKGGQLLRLQGFTVLPDFAELMKLNAVAGDLQEALTRPDTVAITEGAAVRLFGTPDALGRTVLLRLDAVDENRTLARVAAILRDPPANTTIPYEALHGPRLSLIPGLMGDEALTGAEGWRGNLLVRLKPGASVEAVTAALQRAADTAPPLQGISPQRRQQLGDRKVMDIALTPLRDAYFDRDLARNFLSIDLERGDRRVVAALAIIAVLVLALGTINYVNLATIRVIRRQREIALRKVLGAAKQRLAAQFLIEALMVCLVATAIGLLLAWLALPAFGDLMNRDLQSLFSFQNVAIALGIGLALGMLSAAYPAWVALRVPPAVVVAGRLGNETPGNRRLRQALSVVQVGAAIALAGVASAIALQTRFAMTSSPGFDPDALLVFELPTGAASDEDKPTRLITAISEQPAIAAIVVSSDPVGRIENAWSGEFQREGGPAVVIDFKSVSANFFNEYGIRPLAGRLLDPQIDRDSKSTSLVIDAIAAQQLGFATPEQAVGQALILRNSGGAGPVTKRIIGIAPAIRFSSLREEPAAVAYDIAGGTALTVRARGSVADAERAVRSVWASYYPNSVLDISPAREVYQRNYADDARLATLLTLATAVALIIAAFGLYALAADAVQRRTGEIALHRLFGARRRDVGKLLAGEMGSIVIVAAVVSVPLAAVAIARHLSNYTEHSPYVYWALALAPAVALITAALAGARHAWIAMNLRPAVALRS